MRAYIHKYNFEAVESYTCRQESHRLCSVRKLRITFFDCGRRARARSKLVPVRGGGDKQLAGVDSLQLSSSSSSSLRGSPSVLTLYTALLPPSLPLSVSDTSIAPLSHSTLNPQTGKIIHRPLESRAADRGFARTAIERAAGGQAGRTGTQFGDGHGRE